MSFLPSAAVTVARRLLVGMACAALLLVSGCVGPVLFIHLQIAGFEEAAVQGVGVWRESGQPGQWELVAEVPLTLTYRDGREWVLYDIELPDGSMFPLASAVERDIQDPGYVTTGLHYYMDGAGSLRVSAYNPAGHSALSLEELEVQL